MKHIERDFEEVIEEIYSGLIGNYNPEENSRISLHSKTKMIIQKFCEISCLIVLDNYEDVEAVVGKANQENKKKFDRFFEEIEQKARNSNSNSCILITSRVPKSKEDEVTQLFITIDLEKDDAINLDTSREIIFSYFDQQIRNKTEKASQVELARKNMDAKENGWLKVKVSNNTDKFDQGYIQKLIKYPVVCNFIANLMIQSGKPPYTVIQEFLDSMVKEGEVENGGLKGEKLVEYVVSKSYEMLLSEQQKTDLQILIKHLHPSDKISYPEFFEVYQDKLNERIEDISDLWIRLHDLKFFDSN